MKLSDYVVSFLIDKNVTDVFGYPGGMVTHLMDSFDKYKESISAHINYHEQASSFSACGYAQITKKPGVAYATSGPGATNLITGIANAYFDSIPCVFITGQVNTYEAKDGLLVRQKGFQETDIISIVKSITKYSVKIENEKDIKYELEKAFSISINGRPGPVLIDIPMNIQRADIVPSELKGYELEEEDKNILYYKKIKKTIIDSLKGSIRPVILAGNGINSADCVIEFIKFAEIIGIPIVTSMIAKDLMPTDMKNNYGFVGTYGDRCANFIISNSDLIISIGSRVDCRQTGSDLKAFAKKSKLIRIDIDNNEITNKIKDDEITFIGDLKEVLSLMNIEELNFRVRYKKWINVCDGIRCELKFVDKSYENDIIREFSKNVSDNVIITTDVGQNQVWIAQSFIIKKNQRLLFSGGHGAMGYSLPAAIGAYYGSKQKVICFNGDGGLQMNIQELQFIARERIPIKIVVLNNKSLGMIRHFQEMYFESNFTQTKEHRGYVAPDFKQIANAYGISYSYIDSINDILKCKTMLESDNPCFIEIKLCDNTYLYPKLAMGRPIHDQDPLLERELFQKLINMCNF
ncbi:thiamine pyrophosphate-binding protein [Clostridium butyricum]|uniref:thiamine pyrophosphate-binding protein n=1 Tax=Clostridium butyricum TaxID=1492 RepID=UPI0034675AED